MDMANAPTKIQVLHQFRPFVHILMIFHPKHFQAANHRHRLRSICHMIGLSLLLIDDCLFLIADAWFCINQQFKLNIIAQPLSFWLATLQMQITYIAIVPKSERFLNIIDFLQAVVDKRKLDFVSTCIS